jgi:hypothetical protein
MTRVPYEPAKKGSQKWIQLLVNEKPELLNSEIRKSFRLSDSETISWLSPLEEDDFAEYRDQDFLDRLDVKLERVHLAEFWPARGPQWDALGRSSSGKLFLVEAKSHISELVSSSRVKDDRSAERIMRSLADTKRDLGTKTELDWSKCFYQYTNRLAHLYLLRKNQLSAYLVFVYFVNDSEMKGPGTVDEWRGAIKLLHACLGIERHKLKKFMADTFIDIKDFK